MPNYLADKIRIEERGALLLAHFPEEPGLEAVQEFFRRMEENLARRRRVVLVIDALKVRTAPSPVREEATRFLTKHKSALRALMIGQATVLASPLIRGALTAMHFVAPPGYPTKSFGDLDKAISWAESLLGQRSEPRP